MPTIIAVATAFSLGVGFYQLLGLDELHGLLQYDDGVWFGSAVRLAHGVVPYRRFVMDQPPGVALLMAPFGFLSRLIGTRDAFGAARLVVPCVEAMSVVAVGWSIRHRGRLAIAFGCGVAAIYPEALVNQRTVMLEPFCALLCMLGLVGVFAGDRLSDRPRRLLLAGAAFGLAGATKAFALLPFSVIVVALLLSSDRRRRLVALLGGAAGAFVVVCLPFLLLAPTQFVHQVVGVQLGRSQKVEALPWARLFSLIGLLPGTGRDGMFPDDPHVVDVLIVAGFFALVLGGWAVARWTGAGHRRRGVTPLDLVALAVVLVTAAGLIQPAAYYTHYAAFLAPFLGVTLGLAAGQLGLAAGRLGPRLPAALAIVAVVALVAGAVQAVDTVYNARTGPYDATVIDALVPPGACVVSDDPAVLLLVDRFTSSVPGCAQMVDTFGTTITADHGVAPYSRMAARSTAAFDVWRQIFDHSQYIVLTRGYSRLRIPWTKRLQRYARLHFRQLLSAPELVLVRRTAAIAPAGTVGAG